MSQWSFGRCADCMTSEFVPLKGIPVPRIDLLCWHQYFRSSQQALLHFLFNIIERKDFLMGIYKGQLEFRWESIQSFLLQAIRFAHSALNEVPVYRTFKVSFGNRNEDLVNGDFCMNISPNNDLEREQIKRGTLVEEFLYVNFLS